MLDHAPPELKAGLVIGDRFRLVRLLGQGGMGSVWVAWHTTLGVEVAVKFIDTAFGARDDMLSRFAQEARTAASIQSPHVVSIIDYGSDEWRRPYIAMELLRGEPLSDKLDREGCLSPAEVAGLVTQTCRGLSKAHAAGVVHRDLKPENLFLCPDDDGYLLKIVDFGIARAQSQLENAGHKTGTGQLLGTPLYMSPEQAFGKSGIDFRSDLYSLAVVAYRCLTGRLPFESNALGELIVAISTLPPPPPSSIRGGLPAGADDWFRRALEKDPAKRFSSAKELADTFAEVCRVAPELVRGRASEPGLGGVAAENLASAVAGFFGTFSGAAATHNDDPVVLPTQRSPAIFLGIGLGVVALGLVGYAALNRSAGGAAASAPPRAGSPAPGLVALASAAPSTSGDIPGSSASVAPVSAPEPSASAAVLPPSPAAFERPTPAKSDAPRAHAAAAKPAVPERKKPVTAPQNDYGL